MKRMLIFLMLLLLFTPLYAFSATEIIPLKEPQKKQPAAAEGAQVAITMSLQSQNGKAVPLKNMEVILCPESAKAEIVKFRATGRILAKQTGDFKALISDLNFMTNKAISVKAAGAQTNSQGIATISGVQKGSYCLYAGYKDEATAGYWVIPVTVANTKKITLKLNNKNIEELVHRK
ncbi:MAG: hypothetical protein WCQ99_04725 [Pseudomonadota bacterium]